MGANNSYAREITKCVDSRQKYAKHHDPVFPHADHIDTLADSLTPRSTEKDAFRHALLKEVCNFCPEYQQRGHVLEPICQLRQEAVRFAVTILLGLEDLIRDYRVSGTQSCLDITVNLTSSVIGDVATRLKLPVRFFVGIQQQLHLSINAPEHGSDHIRLELHPGSLYSVPIENAVQAGNRFFEELIAKGTCIPGVSDGSILTFADVERMAELALQWWEGSEYWDGQSRRVDYEGSRLCWYHDVMAKGPYRGLIPRQNLAEYFLGVMCCKSCEYRAFEWSISKPDGPDGCIITSCEYVDCPDVYTNEQDKFPELRNAITKHIEKTIVMDRWNRQAAEKFAASATAFSLMRSMKLFNVPGPSCRVILRLFTAARCPGYAKQWDLSAQDWQKTADISYACSGDYEGRVIWNPAILAPETAAEGDAQFGQIKIERRFMQGLMQHMARAAKIECDADCSTAILNVCKRFLHARPGASLNNCVREPNMVAGEFRCNEDQRFRARTKFPTLFRRLRKRKPDQLANSSANDNRFSKQDLQKKVGDIAYADTTNIPGLQIQVSNEIFESEESDDSQNFFFKEVEIEGPPLPWWLEWMGDADDSMQDSLANQHFEVDSIHTVCIMAYPAQNDQAETLHW